MWRHNVASHDATRSDCDVTSSHPRPCHSDGTSHLSIVLNYYVMEFYLVALTFDLRPWPTIAAYLRSRSTPMPKIKVIGQAVWPVRVLTHKHAAPILWPRPLTQEVKIDRKHTSTKMLRHVFGWPGSSRFIITRYLSALLFSLYWVYLIFSGHNKWRRYTPPFCMNMMNAWKNLKIHEYNSCEVPRTYRLPTLINQYVVRDGPLNIWGAWCVIFRELIFFFGDPLNVIIFLGPYPELPRMPRYTAVPNLLLLSRFEVCLSNFLGLPRPPPDD